MSNNILKNLFILILITFIGQNAIAQFQFNKRHDIPVSENNKVMKYAWSGGFNNPQFLACDLNNDNIDDLVIFDRTGAKIVTFLNKGTPGMIDYVNAPEYENSFPPVTQWMFSMDFDCDGIGDVLSWTAPPAKVDFYKGRFNLNNEIEFDSITHLSWQDSSGNQTTIFVSSNDYPAFIDVNNDGDIDIITIDQLGHEVEYYENRSMELSGTCSDSLIFEKIDECWGNFIKKDAAINEVIFDSCLTSRILKTDLNRSANVGAALLAYDEDGDGDKELIIGDVSFNRINRLINCGTPDSAYICDQDAIFPSYNVTYDLPIFPISFLLDVNNDGLRDMIVAPNQTLTSENYNCIWYYKNVGAPDSAVFSFQTDTFFNRNAIDLGEGANPVFFDYNSDGLLDIVVGNYGYYIDGVVYPSGLALFENTGTLENPTFKLLDRDYASTSALNKSGMYPAFGDMDADGDSDMIVGDVAGRLHYFENLGGAGNVASFALTTPNYFNIDYNQFSAPFIYDVNGDSLNDLILGARDGRLRYYENIGTATNAVFNTQETTKLFGNVDVRSVTQGAPQIRGYASPIITALDNSGDLYLLSGNNEGNIEVYLFDRNKIYNGSFLKVEDMLADIDEGTRTSLTIADITNDGKVEMIVGNYRGGLALFSSDGLVSSGPTLIATNIFNFNLYPNPVNQFINLEWTNIEGNSVPTLTVVDLLGKIVIQKVLPVDNLKKSQYRLPVDLKPGIYFCEIKTLQGSVTKKFMIQ